MATGPIYSLLSSKTKQAIDEQIAYLKKGHEEFYPEDKVRFEAMQTGAQTVLNILEADGLCNSGTNNYLRQLDYDQLVFAKECVNELLSSKEEEDKILLWCVCSEISSNYYVRTFKEASVKLLEIIKNDLDKYPDRRNDFSIEKEYVRESELDEYLA